MRSGALAGGCVVRDHRVMTTSTSTSGDSAALLCDAWRQGRVIAELPAPLRPTTRAEGYAIQARWADVLGDGIAGWKIAATSGAGQRHIGVSGPLAGPVFARHVRAEGEPISLAANRMRVAECEIVFRLGANLAPRDRPYSRAEVLAAVGSMHPGIEAPDSRFEQFERAGEAQLIADCACTNDMVVGAAAPADARMETLVSLQVDARMADGRTFSGTGSNVLGDPVEALVWLVNELTGAGHTLAAGEFVTTGACVPPIPVGPGDAVEADFGWMGRIAVRFGPV
jgi:2-keto-4-pentenoate hydratase